MSGFFDSLKSIFQSKNNTYYKNPKAANLSKEQLQGLYVGAVLGQQNYFYYNSLATGNNSKDLREVLADSYGIEDGDSIEAREILDWLYEEGHRIYFDRLKTIFRNNNKNAWKADIEAVLGQDNVEGALSYMENLEGSLSFLISQEWITSRADVENMAFDAWDMGRLAAVTRMCYDSKYLLEDEAWSYISDALDGAQKAYTNWESFAKAYIVGRAMWGGYTKSLMGVSDILKGLLNDTNSPWTEIKLK